jgi:orotidine-5'-phosphate decarboxylase
VTPQERLIVALDASREDEARALVGRLRGSVGVFKVGNELFTAAGPGFVRDLVQQGLAVFLDLKYHDIPNTVGASVGVACGLGATLLDVHALAGSKVMRAAVDARGGSQTKLLAITILTSHDESDLRALGIAGSVPESVVRLARLAQDSGMDGVVASPQEAALLRAACGPGFLIVTPGIRPGSSAHQDQARPGTPASALRAGADYLVVGRPITRANDPAQAAADLLREMEIRA